MLKFGIFPGPYFAVNGLNWKFTGKNYAFNTNAEKQKPEKTPDSDTFYAVPFFNKTIRLIDYGRIIEI